MRFQRFTLILALLCFVGAVYSTNSVVDIRLSHNSLNKVDQSLYVNIDVRLDNADQLVLAGQNYRIYYPSNILHLDQEGSKSQLSPNQYSDLRFSELIENVEAQGHGKIKFDNDLGFANFSVELLDNEKGGSPVSGHDGWVTLATLKFTIIDEFEEVSMVWGREGLSASYATAFVEMAEWKAPQQTATVDIDEYIDFKLAISSFDIEGESYEVTIGPNPSSDFIEIKSNKRIANDLMLSVRDLRGQLVRSEIFPRGNDFYTIDVGELQSASYLFEIAEKDGPSLLSQQIIVAR